MSSSDDDASDSARTAILALQLSTLKFDADAPQIHELEWHPTRPMLAAADVDGCVAFYKLRRPAPRPTAVRRPTSTGFGSAAAKAAKPVPPFGGHVQAARLTHHKGPVRSIAFHPSGSYAYSASADKSIGIIDMETLTLASQLQGAHDTGINRVTFFDENLLVSGDDDGFVHVWDLRANNMVAQAAATAAGAAAAAAASRPSKPSPSSSSSSSSGPYGTVLHPLLRYEDAGDYISDFLPIPAQNRLIVTSGDGHLYVYDMRTGHIHEQVTRAYGLKAAKKVKSLGKNKAKQTQKLTPSGHLSKRGASGVKGATGGAGAGAAGAASAGDADRFAVDTWFAMSDDVDDELSGAVLLKRGKKLVVAGREEGVLNTYKWDFFGVAEDHFHLSEKQNDMEGAGASIDCMIKVDEDTLLTGSTDGLIRLVALHPNRLLGIMGTHDEFPIECMRMSPADQPTYFDHALKPLHMEQEDEDSDEEEDEEEEDDEDAEGTEGAGGPKRSAFVTPAKDADEDASVEEGFSFSSLGSSLVPRFLASSSHDAQIKFWNSTELFEVDPDDPVEKDSSDDDEEDEGEDAVGGGSDGDSSDSDDEAAAEKDAEKSMSKQQRKEDIAARIAAIRNAKRKKRADEVEEEEEEAGADEAGSDSDAEEGAGEDEPMATSDSDAGSDADQGDSSDDGDAEAAATRMIQEAAKKVKSSSSNVFARLAPAAAPAAEAAPRPSEAPSTAAAPNMWLLVAPSTTLAAPAAAAAAAPAATKPAAAAKPLKGAAKPAAGKFKGAAAAAAAVDADDSDASSEGDEPTKLGKGRRQEGKDLNADTGFFAHLPASHPMHPSQQHKRKAKAPLNLPVDNIAHRPAKKRAALQEKLAKRREKAARLEARRAEAVARGEDPEAQQLSTDEEDTRQQEHAANKRRKGEGGGRIPGSDSDSDDSDDSDGGKAPKVRKMDAKDRRAAKKAEKKRNPFFDGMM